jgi:trimethylamine:corrinoid methyltransferase-like protein
MPRRSQGIAFTQMVNPGAPMVYGGFTSNVDMKSGAPAFGTPEYIKAALVSGQLARRYSPSVPHLRRVRGKYGRLSSCT